MKTVIHINRPQLQSNAKNGTNLPVITVKDYNQNRKTNCAIIRDSNGKEVARVVFSEKPLSCGARAWVSTDLEVECL